jgi:ectoine hydroxylase-related dioxygenase (phytanoyl-CoA dioxygenase family)
MNKNLPRPVSDEERETYARDGVVCVRGVYDARWAESLLAAWDEVWPDPGAYGLFTTAQERQVTIEGHLVIGGLCRTVAPFQAFVTESPTAELVGGVIRATEVGFVFDHTFNKDAGATGRTPWHNDFPGLPTRGEQLPTVWMPLTPITRDSSLECIQGSHAFETLYWPNTANGHKIDAPPGRPFCPDFETRRDDPDLTFLWWEMEPGDALVIHPRTLHYSCGNHSKTQRRVALTTRWYGDDIVWDPRPECEAGPPEAPFMEQTPGTRPGPPAYPIVWRAGGAKAS